MLETNEMTKYFAEVNKAFFKRGSPETTIDFQNHLSDRKEHIHTGNKEESIETFLLLT